MVRTGSLIGARALIPACAVRGAEPRFLVQSSPLGSQKHPVRQPLDWFLLSWGTSPQCKMQKVLLIWTPGACWGFQAGGPGRVGEVSIMIQKCNWTSQELIAAAWTCPGRDHSHPPHPAAGGGVQGRKWPRFGGTFDRRVGPSKKRGWNGGGGLQPAAQSRESHSSSHNPHDLCGPEHSLLCMGWKTDFFL